MEVKDCNGCAQGDHDEHVAEAGSAGDLSFCWCEGDCAVRLECQWLESDLSDENSRIVEATALLRSYDFEVKEPAAGYVTQVPNRLFQVV